MKSFIGGYPFSMNEYYEIGYNLNLFVDRMIKKMVYCFRVQ
jgi:hypothetical protein